MDFHKVLIFNRKLRGLGEVNIRKWEDKKMAWLFVPQYPQCKSQNRDTNFNSKCGYALLYKLCTTGTFAGIVQRGKT
jgi:hypothetical protein